MHKPKWKIVLAAGFAAILLSSLGGERTGLVSEASAQEPVKWRGVAAHRIGAHYNVWLWMEKRLPEITNGEVSVEVLTLAEVGLGGTEILRVLRAGLVDVADVNASYVAGDFPLIEATDLAGVTTSPEQQEEVAEAWLQNVVAPREDIMGGKVLTSFYWNASFLYSQYPMDTLEGIKGHKVRVYSPGLAQWVNALGGEPVNMVMNEVYSALQRGVIDSLITGPDQVKGLSMWEVAPHMDGHRNGRRGRLHRGQPAELGTAVRQRARRDPRRSARDEESGLGRRLRKQQGRRCARQGKGHDGDDPGEARVVADVQAAHRGGHHSLVVGARRR